MGGTRGTGMLRNQKGAALLQVLLVTVVLAGMATMLLRASLSRTTTARQTRRTVSSQLLINACQAEVNALWSVKKGPVFQRDLSGCWMTCRAAAEQPASSCIGTGDSANASRSFTCTPLTIDNVQYTVTATFTSETPVDGRCRLEYEIDDDQDDVNISL